jgi:hypothetical protein
MPYPSSEQELHQLMTRKGGDGIPLLRLTEDQNTVTVRFLTEPLEWFCYRSYFDAEDKRSYLVEEGESSPNGESVRSKWLANVLNIESDRVMVVDMPQSLAEQIYTRWAKSKAGTIMDRDFELLRSGSGKNNTSYQASPEAPLKRLLDKYEIIDLEEILEFMFTPRVDDDDLDTEPAPKPTTREAVRNRAAIPKPVASNGAGKPAKKLALRKPAK